MSANNSTNGTLPYYSNIDYEALMISIETMYLILFAFATPINAWMLAAIVTSPEILSSMRNKLVCVLLFNNLLGSSILCLMEALEYTVYRIDRSLVDCRYKSFLTVVRSCHLGAESWYLVIFFIYYILTLIEFKPAKFFSQKILQFFTILIVVGPWIVIAIVVSSILVHHSHNEYGPRRHGCLYWTITSWRALSQFSIVAPYFIDAILIIAILILHYHRKRRDASMDSALIGPTTQVDDVRAFMVLYAIVAICQLLLVIRKTIKLSYESYKDRVIYYMVSWYLAEMQCSLVVLLPYFFEDLRYRIRTWRPWNRRPVSGTDLTIRYNRSTEDSRD